MNYKAGDRGIDRTDYPSCTERGYYYSRDRSMCRNKIAHNLFQGNRVVQEYWDNQADQGNLRFDSNSGAEQAYVFDNQRTDLSAYRKPKFRSCRDVVRIGSS